MNNLEENLKKILDLYEKTGDLESIIGELGLSQEQEKKVWAAFDFLDKIEGSARLLNKVKSEGKQTRDEWLLGRIGDAAEKKGYSDAQTENLLENLATVASKTYNERINKE